MIDLAKMIIEKRQAEKRQAKRRQAIERQAKIWRLENELVLLRDILPVVMAELFEKTSPARSDVKLFAKYYESRLAAQQARPAAHQGSRR